MTAPLVEVTITSIYKNAEGKRVPLPKRMAHCTPDMKTALQAVGVELEQQSGRLFLSDLFRSFDMQLQSHMDFVNGKKKAFSPPPGGSLHEAGRALDLDLESLAPVKLAEFWELARPHGLLPIINKPTPGVSESWHFDCRGSHHIVYEYCPGGERHELQAVCGDGRERDSRDRRAGGKVRAESGRRLYPEWADPPGPGHRQYRRQHRE